MASLITLSKVAARRILLCLAVCLVLILCVRHEVEVGAQVARQIDFQREVRPILSDKCFSCHGPDSKAKGIKLRLDTEDSARADLGRGRFAVVPGDPSRSELAKRISHSDPSMRMPPVDSGKTLTAGEIQTLTEWIRQGAKWQSHWAFIKPSRPALPEVRNNTWGRNEIDRFILARLEAEGLSPSAEAGRATLLRRVSLDLTGLPPTPQELQSFEQDRSSDAYERVVDRLLASPRFGERMAFKWLDASRYSDTNGYQIDGDRSAWRWRDWVIDAFNTNKSFDRFIIEQLAGDLLPDATLDQRIATAFNRNHRINAEGGIVPEEYRNEYVIDRIDTTSTVFMGLTLGCARCHNHKYDPFSQKDYYQIGAYFNSIDEDGHSFDQGNSPPTMIAPTAEQLKEMKSFDSQLEKSERDLKEAFSRLSSGFEQWQKEIAAKKGRQWFPEDSLLVRVPLDGKTEPEFRKSSREYHEDYGKGKDDKPTVFEIGFKGGSPQLTDSPVGGASIFDGKLYYDAGIHADFRYKSTSRDYKERFTISAWVFPEEQKAGSIVTKISDSVPEMEGNVPRSEGYGLYFIDGKVHFNMVFRWGEDALRAETRDPVAVGQWHHVAVVFDGTRQWEDRVHVFIDGKEAPLKFNQRSFFLLFGGTKNTLKLGGGGGPGLRFKGKLSEVRLYSRALSEEELGILSCSDPLDQIAKLEPSRRSPLQQAKLTRAYFYSGADKGLLAGVIAIDRIRARKLEFIDTLPTLMVMAELPSPRPTFVLKRGSYDAPGEEVKRAVPAALPPLPADAPNNRLGFARWLVSREHPLTSRVLVNRFWQMFFGTGIVRTAEDFGSQGEVPSHPELLDWLAVDFQERGWNAKQLIKSLVMSATYRQSSVSTPAQLQRDPENRLLARGPRFRLSAEMIRDQALFVSGLLVEKVGGPSVKPYQPSGLYKDMAFGGLTGYDQSHGEGLWRRSLYTYWKRTILQPNMQVFDASAREFCQVRESRTNTPLQALNLMNDVTYLEAARMLAERMMTEGGKTDEDRLRYGFLLAASRAPRNEELAVLVRNLSAQRELLRSQGGDSLKLLKLGEKRNREGLVQEELVAYTTVASLLLNLDEVITRQ